MVRCETIHIRNRHGSVQVCGNHLNGAYDVSRDHMKIQTWQQLLLGGPSVWWLRTFLIENLTASKPNLRNSYVYAPMYTRTHKWRRLTSLLSMIEDSRTRHSLSSDVIRRSYAWSLLKKFDVVRQLWWALREKKRAHSGWKGYTASRSLVVVPRWTLSEFCGGCESLTTGSESSWKQRKAPKSEANGRF